MPDSNLDQVPAACGDLYRSGLAALERSEVEPAIASFIQALEMEPGFVTCREALRRAQQKAAEKKPGFWKKIFRKGRVSPSLSEAEVLLRLQPLKVISLAERALNQDPGNTTAHKLLAKAALAADLPRTAVLSLEALASEQPEHRAFKLELADALARSGDTSTAAAIYGQLLKDNPGDGSVLRALKKISAQPVAENAPLAEDTHAPEMASASTPTPALPTFPPPDGSVTAISADDATINRFEPLLAHCPRNIKIHKMLAEAYARKMMFDKSLDLYQRALAIAGDHDAGLKKAIAETHLKKFDQELSRLDPKAPEAAARREQIQNQRLECQWHEMAEPR